MDYKNCLRCTPPSIDLKFAWTFSLFQGSENLCVLNQCWTLQIEGASNACCCEITKRSVDSPQTTEIFETWVPLWIRLPWRSELLFSCPRVKHTDNWHFREVNRNSRNFREKSSLGNPRRSNWAKVTMKSSHEIFSILTCSCWVFHRKLIRNNKRCIKRK